MGFEVQKSGQPTIPGPITTVRDGAGVTGGEQVSAARQTAPAALAQRPALTVGGQAPAPLAGLPASGAPPLAAALLDPDTANVLVAGILDKITTQDMQGLMTMLKDASKRLDSLNAEKLKKFAEKAAKAVEEAKKQREQKISGDIGFGFSVAGAVLGMIGAVLLTVFTLGGGAAAIAGAAIGLGTVLLDGADRIAKENNLMDSGINKGKQMSLSLGGLVARLVQEIVLSDPKLEKLTAEQKEKLLGDLKMACEIIVMVAVAAGTLACAGVSMAQIGGTAAKAGTEAAKAGAEATKFAATQGAKLASQGAETMQILVELAGGANSIVSGTFGVQMANITFEKNQIDNQRQKLESFAQIVKSEVDANQDSLMQRMESLSSMYETLAATNKNYYESQQRLTTMN